MASAPIALEIEMLETEEAILAQRRAAQYRRFAATS